MRKGWNGDMLREGKGLEDTTVIFLGASQPIYLTPFPCARCKGWLQENHLSAALIGRVDAGGGSKLCGMRLALRKPSKPFVTGTACAV